MHQHFLLEQREVPLLLGLDVAEPIIDAPRERLVHHLQRFSLQLFTALERERAQRVDHLALLIHHVVVVEQALSRLEVLQLDALLRLVDRARDQRVREHLAFLRAHPIHQLRDALRPEETHQVVFERQEELRRARISLTTGIVRAAAGRCAATRDARSR